MLIFICMNYYNLAIIGGGASGIAATIQYKRLCPDGKVILLEAASRLGKKLSASGNGQGNIGNTKFSMEYYHGDIEFAEKVFNKIALSDILEFLSICGVEPKFEPSGRIYPQSFQASSITDCLLTTMQNLGVIIKCDFIAEKILSDKKHFKIVSKAGEEVLASAVVVACGGIASPNLSGGTGYKLLTDLGHVQTNLTPSLVQLKTVEKFGRLAGIRLNSKITVKDDEKTVFTGTDDVLFTAYGISGTAVFSASSYITRPKGKLSLYIDFLPEYSFSQLTEILSKRKKMLSNHNKTEFFTGFLNNKLGQELLNQCKIDLVGKVESLSSSNIKTLADKIKNFKLTISGSTGFNNAQVTSGGIMTRDFNETLMSKKVKGLYACGEILDVDGDCGGYNLMWAFASGILCGRSIAQGL